MDSVNLLATFQNLGEVVKGHVYFPFNSYEITIKNLLFLYN